MLFESENVFEQYVRNGIVSRITKKNRSIYPLDAKKAVDILICRDEASPALFFLAMKYYKRNNDAYMSVGHGGGAGLQPAILKQRPVYFETHVRWVLASAEHQRTGILFLTSEQIAPHIMGGKIGTKQNGILASIFNKNPGLQEDEFFIALEKRLVNDG